MLKRIGILIGLVAMLASATTTHAGPWPCNLCAAENTEIPKCIGCGSCPGCGTLLGSTDCQVDPFTATCVLSGGVCPLPSCSSGGGGGGDVCIEGRTRHPCPIEIFGVVLAPGDEGSGSATPRNRGAAGRIVSGLGNLSFQDVLLRILGESPGWAGPMKLDGWHYAVGRERIRGGLVADDGAGYVLSARPGPSGIHLTVYSASRGKPGRPVSVALLSPDQLLVFEESIRGRTHLVVIGAHAAGSQGPETSDDLTARQLDFLSALAAFPAGPDAQMRWLSASEAQGIPE